MASSIHWKIILLAACLCWSSCLSQNPKQMLFICVREAVEGIKNVSDRMAEMDDKFTEKFGESQMAVHGKVEGIEKRIKKLKSTLQSSQNSVATDIKNMMTDETIKIIKGLDMRMGRLEAALESSQQKTVSSFRTELTEKLLESRQHLGNDWTSKQFPEIAHKITGSTSEIKDTVSGVTNEVNDLHEKMDGLSNSQKALVEKVEDLRETLDGLNDVDECASVEDRCHEHAECRNIIGNYTCACNPGFDGDGFNCRELPCVHPYFNIPGIKGCLILVEEWKTWIEASRHCSDGGGRLVEGWDSNAQSELLSDYVNKTLGYTWWVWVGSQDRRWTEGKADVPSVLFRESDPTTHYLKDYPYAVLDTDNKRLYDYDDSLSFYFVCQRTSPPHPHNNDHNDD